MKKSGICIGALGVCVVVALVVGFAGAAVITPHSVGTASKIDIATWQSNGAPGGTIDHLKQQGVAGSVPGNAIRNGDKTALKSWPKAYRGTNYQNQIGNNNRQTSEKIFSCLEKQGIDVTIPKTAMQNGDTPALKSWALGKIISHLEEQGIDVTVPKAAMQNGDMAALQTWFEEYLTQQGVDVTVPKAAMQNGDMAALQTWVEEYLTQQGVDVTVPKAAMQNGDMAALQTWVEEYLTQQGVDVTVPKTAIQNGDRQALKTWLDEFRASH